MTGEQEDPPGRECPEGLRWRTLVWAPMPGVFQELGTQVGSTGQASQSYPSETSNSAITKKRCTGPGKDDPVLRNEERNTA